MKNNWLNRLFSSKLRCEKFGHKIIERKITIRKRSSWPTVVEDYEAISEECSRCGEVIDIHEGEYITGYHGCEMSNYRWEEIRKKGYTII